MSMENLPRPIPASDSEGSFHRAKDGTKIFVHDFKPQEEYVATIFYLAGITGRNHNNDKDIIELLSNNKHRVVVIHPRGTGYSEGKRGDIARFDDFIDDQVEIIKMDSDYLSQKHKLVLYGHSMSTAVALSIGSKLSKVDGIVLVNPPYLLKKAEGASPSAGQYLRYGFYYLFAPHTPIVNMAGDPSKIRNEADRQDSESRIKDPMLVRYFSLSLMSKSKKMMDSMLENAQKVDCPLLLIYGLQDNIVEKKGCDLLFEAWKNPNKQYIIVEDGTHGKLTVLKSIHNIQDWVSTL